jgi:hypothetical protein
MHHLGQDEKMATTTAQLVDKEPEKIASFLLLETET